MKSARFQFSIFDFLLVTLLTGMGILWFSPTLVEAIEYPVDTWRRRPSPEAQAIGVALIGAISFISAFGILWIKKPRKYAAGFLICGSMLGQIVLMLLAVVIKSPRHSYAIAPAAACKAFAEAEEIYHRTDYNNDGVLEYAASLHDLLCAPNGTEIALVDRAFAAAEIGLPKTVPKAGYVFKVLHRRMVYKTQNEQAYISVGSDGVSRMVKGYALVACPAEYDVTGVTSYMISNQGTIYERDLGPETRLLVDQMNVFDPDPNKGWSPTE